MTANAQSLSGEIDTDGHALIRRVAAGDRVAYDRLYRHYAPDLLRYLRSQLGQPTLAEDICQEVLLLVWRRANQFRYESRLSTWIYGIAWRLARKAQAQLSAQAKALTLPFGTAFDRVEPSQELQGHEVSQSLSDSIDQLPVPLQQTVRLQYYHGYSYQQIADKMGCSEDRVKVRLRQGRQRLAGMLRRYDRG